MIYRKNRYGMSIPMQKHRVLSVGLALPKRHFRPASQTFLNVWARGWFRIGKYDTKSTSTTYACINAASSILLALKAIKVDFVSVFIERIDARLERMLTIYRKTRYEMRVPMLKYRFLSIGLLLRRSIFSLHLEMFNFSSPLAKRIRGNLKANDHRWLHPARLLQSESLKIWKQMIISVITSASPLTRPIRENVKAHDRRWSAP